MATSSQEEIPHHHFLLPPNPMPKRETSSHEEYSYGLPNDLIERIIPSLPVKSICKFKCLSKSWKQFLSSLYLARIHYISHRLPSAPFALFYTMKGFFCLRLSDIVNGAKIPLKPIKLLSGDHHKQINVASHSNGLVCYMPWEFNDALPLAICNPATHDHIALPRLPQWSRKSKGRILGFYFNPSSVSFTILVTFFLYTTIGVEHWLFSSSNGYWKKITDGFELFPHPATYLCIKGRCYRLYNDYQTARIRVAIFDLDRGKWATLALPSEVKASVTTPLYRGDDKDEKFKLVEGGSGDKICLVDVSIKEVLRIWNLCLLEGKAGVMVFHWEEKARVGLWKDCEPLLCFPSRDIIFHQHYALVVAMDPSLTCIKNKIELLLYDVRRNKLVKRSSMKLNMRRGFLWVGYNGEDGKDYLAGHIHVFPYRETLLHCHYKE
ncbi:putative F-box protein At5g42430 [Amborella trichopoda]|uniref:Uncharacterized protein n=1 Tax=Amborella trichopoda TaxID=13333 RepID=W1PIP1_AMBTC|nr:putative F-box protein At5g42430 [Amborella trichopoda]ERN07501.1 hypothetical protein AMTR_s00667p00011980 [Amborella trichopoda]|eukprot:XP_006845826.1 putative F-box protein At5g42430 [Amborella trichopoda]